MKEIDLGYTYETGCCPEIVDTDEKEITYPSLYVNSMKVSDGQDVDDEFYAKVKLCKKSIRKTKSGYDCEYEVKSMAPMPDKKEIKEFGEMLDEAMEE